jgi:hypothetical protein
LLCGGRLMLKQNRQCYRIRITKRMNWKSSIV